MSAYLGQEFWAADSLANAYFYNDYLYISAKGGNENLILKIENPLIGDNPNVEIELIGKSITESGRAISRDINVYLNVLDTINAQPSLVNGTFSGQFTLKDGEVIEIYEGKINNALTHNLFCEKNIRSVTSSNTDISGQWELVKIVNKVTNEIQHPVCNENVYLNFFSENYLPENIDIYGCNLLIQGIDNSLTGDYTIHEDYNIEIYNGERSDNETSRVNAYFDYLAFEGITGSSTFFINNDLMHLESDDFVTVLHRAIND